MNDAGSSNALRLGIATVTNVPDLAMVPMRSVIPILRYRVEPTKL